MKHRNWTDLENLVDAMYLTEQWDEDDVGLDRDIDVEWAKRQHMRQSEVPSEVIYQLTENHLLAPLIGTDSCVRDCSALDSRRVQQSILEDSDGMGRKIFSIVV